jgi:hypothetical protein
MPFDTRCCPVAWVGLIWLVTSAGRGGGAADTAVFVGGATGIGPDVGADGASGRAACVGMGPALPGATESRSTAAVSSSGG